MATSAVRFASLIAGLAVFAGIGMIAGSVAHATGPTPGSAAVDSRASAAAGLTTRLAGPCRYRDGVTDCQGINPQIDTYIIYNGDVSGCTFKWQVAWGDGTKKTTVVQTSPPDGYVFLASHRYPPESAASYTFVERGTLLAGSCTITNGHEIFRLLSYVALGDSYSSGTGSTDYLPGTGFGFQGGNECLRSVHAYSELIDENSGNPAPNKKKSQTFLFRACNGAVISNFNNTQITDDKKKVPAQLSVLDGLSASVGVVTFTIGGNDALFASVMKYCATRTKKSKTCQQKWGAAVDAALAKIQPKLVKLYGQVKSSAALASGAQVLVLGYPRFFPPGQSKQCPTGVPFHHFLPSDMKWINSEILHTDNKIQAAAQTAGVTYVNDYSAFRDHELCDKKPYLNYIVNIPLAAKFVESYHPNAKGQSVFARLAESTLKSIKG